MLTRRPAAAVGHRHREDLPSFLGMLARYAAGASWLNARYPGSSPRWPLSPYELRAPASTPPAIRWRATATRRPSGSSTRSGCVAHNVGYRSANEIRGE